MIRKQFLFPQFYINKIPYCDDCKIPLQSTGTVLMSSPPQYEYKCYNCGKEYSFKEDEIQGEWKWRAI